MRKWLLLAALACGCAEADPSATPARVFGVTALDSAMVQDGSEDAGETATDVPSVDVTVDVQGDQLGVDVVTNDVLDSGDGATPDAPDAITPTDSGADVADGSSDGGIDASDAALDAPDVATLDVQSDRPDVVVTDTGDSGGDVITDTSPDVTLDVPDVSTDTGTDVPVDTGPPPCPTGQSRCGGICVDTQTDNAHCGGCNRSCSLGAVCSRGACGSLCSPTESRCGDSCVDTRTSITNCGGCDNACPVPANAAPVCASSACGMGACNTGFANCDGSSTNGCEVDTRTSRTNCGMCGRVCSFANAASSCVAGACSLGACNAGFGNCDGNAANGCEAVLVNDPNNCGACGSVCATHVCNAGSCAAIVRPRLDVVWAPGSTEVRGFDVRVSHSTTNATGTYRRTLDPTMRACLGGVETVTSGCRINVREQFIPGTSTPITGWTSSMWAFELRLLRADGSPLCADVTCGGRWDSTSRTFRGLTVRCANPGARVPSPPIDFDFAFGSGSERVLAVRRSSAPGPGICEE